MHIRYFFILIKLPYLLNNNNKINRNTNLIIFSLSKITYLIYIKIYLHIFFINKNNKTSTNIKLLKSQTLLLKFLYKNIHLGYINP